MGSGGCLITWLVKSVPGRAQSKSDGGLANDMVRLWLYAEQRRISYNDPIEPFTVLEQLVTLVDEPRDGLDSLVLEDGPEQLIPSEAIPFLQLGARDGTQFLGSNCEVFGEREHRGGRHSLSGQRSLINHGPLTTDGGDGVSEVGWKGCHRYTQGSPVELSDYRRSSDKCLQRTADGHKERPHLREPVRVGRRRQGRLSGRAANKVP